MVRAYYFIRITEYVVRITRFFVPWTLRMIWGVILFIAAAVVTFWAGVPTRTERIANEWLDRAVKDGFPTQWDRQLYWTLRIWAWVTIIVGWIVLSYLTVTILRLLF